MKALTYIVLVYFSANCFADSIFGDFYKIDNASFKSRLHIKGNLFVTDGTGKKLISPTTDVHDWRAGVKSKAIEGDWNTKANGIRDVAMDFSFQINDDNSLKVSIRQYESIPSPEANRLKHGKVMVEKEFVLENFEPITWVAESTDTHRVILRFTPELENYREENNLEKIPIGGDRGSFTITDNHGYLWGDNVRLGGVYSGISSHRGAVVFSFYPFKGAKESGYAIGKLIELRLSDDLVVQVKNDEALIPGEGKVKVYAKYAPNYKMSKVGSVYSFGQQEADKIPKEFGL